MEARLEAGLPSLTAPDQGPDLTNLFLILCILFSPGWGTCTNAIS